MISTIVAILCTGFAQATPAEIVAKADKQLVDAQTISGKIIQLRDQGDLEVDFAIKKPGYWKMVSSENEFHSDSASAWMYYKQPNKYLEQPLTDEGLLHIPLIRGLDPFFVSNALENTTSVEWAKWESKNAVLRVVEFGPWTINIYYDPKTALPLAWEQPTAETKVCSKYVNLKLNPDIKASEFDWELPDGATDIREGQESSD